MKIYLNDPVFFRNDRTTIAKVTCTVNSRLFNYCDTRKIVRRISKQRNSKFIEYGFDTITFSCIGYTTRSLEDKEDRVLAERIAQSKANTKCYKIVSAIAEECELDFRKKANELAGLGRKSSALMWKELQHVRDLYGETTNYDLGINRDGVHIWIGSDGYLHASKKYVLEHTRMITETDGSIIAVDPSGGPMLRTGDVIDGKEIQAFVPTKHGIKVAIK